MLAMQGAFAEHIGVLRQAGGDALPVRLPGDLEGLDGLVIPGGESTTISRLMREYGLVQPVRDMAQQGLPLLGICAGLVLLASEVGDPRVEPLALMDIGVKRNAFGRQVDSFETDLDMPVLGEAPFRAIFIRAPIVERAGPEVDVLARLDDGTVVAVRQGKLLAAAFHPELTGDLRFHRYFLDLAGSA